MLGHSTLAIVCVFSLVFPFAVGASMVTVNVCNGFPGSGLLSLSWGSATSSRVGYQQCVTVLVDNTITMGRVDLWASSSAATPIQTDPINALTNFCTDGNRNVMLAYETITGSLTAQWPAQSSGPCSAIPSGDAILFIITADCAVNSGLPVDLYLQTTAGTLGTKLNKTPVICGSGVDSVMPISSGSPASSMVNLYLYNSGTTVNPVAGPISLNSVSSINPASDQTVMVVVSGDANNSITAWALQTMQPSSAEHLHQKHIAGIITLLLAVFMLVFVPF